MKSIVGYLFKTIPMKKSVIYLLFILITGSCSVSGQVPEWQWVKHGGGVGSDKGNFLAIDSHDNLYVIGNYRDFDMSFEDLILNNAGQMDIFFAKYDNIGNLLWVKNFGSDLVDSPSKIIIDSNDDVYIVGHYFSSSLTFDTITLTNPDNSAGFIVKFDSSGQVISAKNADHNNFIIDDLNNKYFIKRIDLLTTAVEKRNTSDSLIWSVPLVTSDYSAITISKLWVDLSGAYLTGGFFGDSLTIENQVLINTNPINSNDMFVARLDTSGNLLWAKKAFSISGDQANSIVVDIESNSYVIGNYSVSIIFDTISLSSNGGRDLFVVKYNPEGQVIWAKSSGGANNDFSHRMTIDSIGGIYILVDSYSPSYNFSGVIAENVDFTGESSDLFVLKYSSNGDEDWIKAIQSEEDDSGNSIGINTNGDLFVTGSIQAQQGSTTNIGNISITHFGHDDYILAKLSLGTNGIKDISEIKSLTIFPNPSNGEFRISNLAPFKGGFIAFYNPAGQLIKQQSILENSLMLNFESLSKGIYLVKVIKDNIVLSQKILLE